MIGTELLKDRFETTTFKINLALFVQYKKMISFPQNTSLLYSQNELNLQI